MVFWLAHGQSYTVVSRVFDVPKTTVLDMVYCMCDTILSLLSVLISVKASNLFPTAQPLATVWEPWMDATSRLPMIHTSWITSTGNCLQLQGICDSTGKYLDIFVCYPRSVTPGYEEIVEYLSGAVTHQLGSSSWRMSIPMSA